MVLNKKRLFLLQVHVYIWSVQRIQCKHNSNQYLTIATT